VDVEIIYRVRREVGQDRTYAADFPQFFAIAVWAAARVISRAQTLVWSEFSGPSFLVAGVDSILLGSADW
jgi:hypothetical protein